MAASECNIVNTFKNFVHLSFHKKDLLFSLLLLKLPFIRCRLPQGSPISFTHSPSTEKRGTPRLESSSHLIVRNNRTGAVKLWQLGWGKISNNYEWDFKCLSWNTLQSPYHKAEILWKLPENSSKRNLGETWQVLMTQPWRNRKWSRALEGFREAEHNHRCKNEDRTQEMQFSPFVRRP